MNYPLELKAGGVFRFEIDGTSFDIDIEKDVVVGSPEDILELVRSIEIDVEEHIEYATWLDKVLNRPTSTMLTRYVYRG